MELYNFNKQIAKMKTEDIIKFLSSTQKEELLKLLQKEKSKIKDNIFLLSVEEYNTYKEKISCSCCSWWLRSSGDYRDYAAFVLNDGSVHYRGGFVGANDVCVRPVIRYNYFDWTINRNDKIVTLGTTWKILDEELAIAEMPIFCSEFNDKEDNNYETSLIRDKLLEWADERICW